jgi:hypothetical protein
MVLDAKSSFQSAIAWIHICEFGPYVSLTYFRVSLEVRSRLCGPSPKCVGPRDLPSDDHVGIPKDTGSGDWGYTRVARVSLQVLDYLMN